MEGGIQMTLLLLLLVTMTGVQSFSTSSHIAMRRPQTITHSSFLRIKATAATTLSEEEEESADSTADKNATSSVDQAWSVTQKEPAQDADSASPSVVEIGRPIDVSDVATVSSQVNSMFAIDPAEIEIVPLGINLTGPYEASIPVNGNVGAEAATASPSFVKMFRGSASYIANHRNTLVVYHLPGELLEWDGYRDLMDDIALTWLLGLKIVLCCGCRHQINSRLAANPPKTDQMQMGLRVTDEETLRMVKEEAGYVRFEVERQMARSLRRHGGFSRSSNPTTTHPNNGQTNPNSPFQDRQDMDGNVVSGNFFSAQPLGILDGVDYKYTGFPRKIETDKIRQVHATHDIVLLTSLGVSPSGEVFNVNSEALAATAAGALDASKVIFFTVHGTTLRYKDTENVIQSLRLSDARNLLQHCGVEMHGKGFASIDKNKRHHVEHSESSVETLLKIGWSMTALQKGVKRAHIIAPSNGALLQELYTRDGSGILISRDLYDGIRQATVGDVAGIYDLITPLIKVGTLVDRPREVLERDIQSYYVYTRDNLIVACGQLKRFENSFAEIGCLVVSKEYRSQGRGDAMLGYLERLCLQSGATKIFVLSTQTMEWFIERGFTAAKVEDLPPTRAAVYNHVRRSKIYLKNVDSDRDLDASELWWNR
uniref:amino-acid N-acetyltransferase n=1 Tax=Attheya septentrionalis TaxID=420275 RepID=A0A7S2UF80_9STRA|mmetsp:Transcript_23075/g.41644  ORF Transcript_23075/g.41644 Transcript_23075/m.41644 type:complete len:654 (+) Transcript_23075:166-2127(+)